MKLETGMIIKIEGLVPKNGESVVEMGGGRRWRSAELTAKAGRYPTQVLRSTRIDCSQAPRSGATEP